MQTLPSRPQRRCRPCILIVTTPDTTSKLPYRRSHTLSRKTPGRAGSKRPSPNAGTTMAQPYEPVDGSASPRRKRILVALAATAVLFVGAVAVYGTPSSALEDFKKNKEKMWAPELEKQYRECATAQRYRNEHVKAVHDSPVASLFEYSTLKGEAKFEASDVVRIGEHFYSICDSSWAVLRVHESLPMRSKLNAHMGDPQHGFAEGESGFEGIFHDKTQDGMYVVREAVDISGVFPAHSFHAIDATAAARLRHRRGVRS